MDKSFYIYILASRKGGALYIGVTGDLIKRVYEHKHGLVEGFTNQYNVKKLVYFETTPDIHSALEREKRLKKWNRDWKIRLIEKANPEWNDLYQSLIGFEIPAKSPPESAARSVRISAFGSGPTRCLADVRE